MSTSSNNPPDDPTLAIVYGKVTKFVKLFTDEVSNTYGGSNWQLDWNAISNNYEQMSISDMVYTPAITAYSNDGWFGGFGMTDDEAQLFALIGSGDGSWGAFYEVAAMWFIRCVMFGFNSKLQSVVGILDKNDLPNYNQATRDSDGTILTSPLYQGIQTLSEWLFYGVAPGETSSLYDAIIDANIDTYLFVNARVNTIAKQTDGNIRVDYTLGTTPSSDTFDHVIVTPTLWASQISIDFVGFDNKTDIPDEVFSARNSQHNITS